MIDDKFKTRIWKDFRNNFSSFINECQIPVRRGAFCAFRALAILHIGEVFRPEGEDIPIGMVLQIGAKIVAEDLSDFRIGETGGTTVRLSTAIFHREVFWMFIE